MEAEKLICNFSPGCDKVELTIREGDAPEKLKELPPLKQDIEGTIETPANYLEKRVDAEQFAQKDCNVIVDREKVGIKLTINESDPYKCGTVKGKLAFDPVFLKFGINTGKAWSPVDLGLFVKMNRAFFNDKKTNMELVNKLMNYQATVNAQVQQSVAPNGSRTDNFAQVVNSNLPPVFVLNIAIFKGRPKETVEVETFAKIDGRDVVFTLLSPGAQESLEAIRDKVIDEQIERIKQIAPDIVIIEV